MSCENVECCIVKMGTVVSTCRRFLWLCSFRSNRFWFSKNLWYYVKAYPKSNLFDENSLCYELQPYISHSL